MAYTSLLHGYIGLMRRAWSRRGILEQRAIVASAVGIVFVAGLLVFLIKQDVVLYYAKGNPFLRSVKAIQYRTAWTLAGNTSLQFGATSASATTTDNEHERGISTSTAAVPILAYHGITEKEDGSAINLTENRFREHMEALKAAGYTTITPEELLAFVHGEQPLPHRSILITFDDGRRDSFERATPILDALDFHAVMFLISKFSSKNTPPSSYYLEGPTLNALAAHDVWSIGSHSHNGHEIYSEERGGSFESHFFGGPLFIPGIDRSETIKEFRERIAHDYSYSQKLLEELSSKPVRFFSYPFGDIGENIDEGGALEKVVIEEASKYYDALFYQVRTGEHFSHVYSGWFKKDETATFRRTDVRSTWSGNDLIAILKRGSAKTLPYADTFERDNGWISAWGTYQVENASLTIAPAPQDTGAGVILDGTGHWHNYTFSATITRLPQTSTLLWVRFRDDFNNVGCNFGDGFVHAEEIIDGQKRVIRGVRAPSLTPSGQVRLSASINGREIRCAVNGSEIVRSPFIDPNLATGGIGVKTWNQISEQSALTVHKISVEAK